MVADVEIGYIVYVYERWSGRVVKAEVIKLMSADPEKVFGIKYICFVDKNGRELDNFYGESARQTGNMWISAKEAYEFIENKSNHLVESYKAEIKTVEDLVLFPLSHCFCGEEYTEYEAIKAYKIRCKELLGVDINE